MQSLEKLKKQLIAEGYREVYIWRDSPNKIYKPHSHRIPTKLIILEGDMILTLEGKELKLSAGKVVEIKAQATHSAIVGKKGCKYLVGEGKTN